MAGAPLYAQMLWTLHRRQEHHSQNLDMRLTATLENLERAVTGSARVNQEAYDELRKIIGEPGDEVGLGSFGMAGEVSAVKRAIGREPVEGMHPGSGILGRLAKHDANRTWWDNRWREARGAAVVIGFCGFVIWALIGDQFKHLFAAKVGG